MLQSRHNSDTDGPLGSPIFRPDLMFGGFDPSGDPDRSFFERRRAHSLLAAVILVGSSLGSALWLASREEAVVEEEEILDAEVQNLEMEMEEEPEPPEPEPPPPEPPSSEPKPKKSKPAPVIQNVEKADANPDEGNVSTEGQTGGGGGGNNQRSDGDSGKKPEPKPEPKVEDKPKPKPKKVEIDDTKPIERPEEATVPKKIGGDDPVFPDELHKRNITGKIKVKLTIYKDGSVKGAKVLAKKNSVDPEEDPELAELAHKLFLKAVDKAIRTWKFEPSKYKGKPITVYQTIDIPFSLE